MADWKKICCAVDFSDPSRAAMETGADLSRRLEADLTLLYVYDAHAPSPEILLEKYEHAAPEFEAQLKAFKAAAERIAGRPIRTVALTGSAPAEIVRFAHDGAFDLLVLSTHGRTGLARVVLGSVAEHVVREATCPVLVVHLAPTRAA